MEKVREARYSKCDARGEASRRRRCQDVEGRSISYFGACLGATSRLPKTFKDCSSDMRIVKERQSVTNSWEKTATHYRKRDREQAEEIYSILGKQMRILREERASIEMELEWEDPQGGNTGTVSTTTATTSTTTTTASTTATTASVAPSQRRKRRNQVTKGQFLP